MTESIPDEQLPRFIVATKRYAAYLGTLAANQPESVDVPGLIDDTMRACTDLTGAAQNYEFASTHPDLADTEAATFAAHVLITGLAQPAIPAEVRQIYEDLYGEELSRYVVPDS